MRWLGLTNENMRILIWRVCMVTTTCLVVGVINIRERATESETQKKTAF
jgi:hypothetical protein